MDSACDHIDHTKTQLVYAITVAAIAILFGYIPAGLGMPVIITLPLAIAVTAAVVYFIGKPIEEEEEAFASADKKSRVKNVETFE